MERRFNYLSSLNKEGILVYGDGVLIDGNEALARMFGYDLDELMGKDVIEFLATPESKDVIRDRLARKSTTRYEVVARRKDGTSKFEALVGYPREEVENRMKWSDFVAEEDITRMRAYHRQRSSGTGEPPEEYECTVVDRSGKRRCVIVNIGIIPEFGYRVVSLNEITERKRAEAALHQLTAELEQRVMQWTAQLDAANQELKSYVYAVSHDLRAPLRHITSFAEILREEYGRLLNDEGRRYLQTILGRVQSMNTLINGLLEISHVGHREMVLQAVDLNQVVEQVRNELQPETEGRTIQWRVGDLPAVFGDPVLLKSVVENLLSNAVKFTRNVEPSVIEISPLPPGKCGFMVKDNGAGFDMAQIEDLYRAFGRLHAESDFPGMGIGLAIVKKIVSIHHGATWAEALPGHGATFYVALPECNEGERS